MKKNYEVTLLNQKFNLKTEDEARHVQRVSDYVNQKIFEIQEKTPSVSSLNVALLTALNIADDYFKMKEKGAKQSKLAKEKVAQMILDLDRSLT